MSNKKITEIKRKFIDYHTLKIRQRGISQSFLLESITEESYDRQKGTSPQNQQKKLATKISYIRFNIDVLKTRYF